MWEHNDLSETDNLLDKGIDTKMISLRANLSHNKSQSAILKKKKKEKKKKKRRPRKEET